MAWIGQKSETEQPNRGGQPAAAAPQPGSGYSPTSPVSRPSCTIGKSVKINGNITAAEDLTIEGTVDGKVVLEDHVLTVGPNGKITNEVQAKSVVVRGDVTGNIHADDKVEVAATGSMHGDITAPRVILADGARFKGSIDMAPRGSQSGSKPEASHAPQQAGDRSNDMAKSA